MTRKQDSYLRCLKFNYVGLEELMRQDEAFWNENLDSVKVKASQMKQQI